MRTNYAFRALVVAGTVAAMTSMVSAQAASGGRAVAPAPSTATPGLMTSPGSTSTTGIGAGTTTGMGGGVSEPGAPNISTPGRIGTGASPSGLPGDSTTAPGFPGKVGG